MFNKPALTVDQQINLLIKRGMKIANRNFAQQNLSHINYYRLNVWQTGYDELVKEYIRSKETFAEHFRTNYATLKSPPIWVSSEMMMLG